MPTHCPACKNPVPPDAEDCPFCPMSFRQDEQQLSEQRLRPTLPPHVKILIGVLLLGGAGYAAWLTLDFMMTHGNYPDERKLAAALHPPARPQQGEGTARTLAAEPPKEGQETEEEETQAVEIAAEKPAEVVKEWKLRGVIYDLETLKPVEGCTMVFFDVSANARFETMTDDQGRYRVIVPQLGERAYKVKIAHQGYASSYLNPGTENVPKMDQEYRRQLVQELGKSLEGPYSVQAYGSRPLVTDFYIAPLSGGTPP